MLHACGILSSRLSGFLLRGALVNFVRLHISQVGSFGKTNVSLGCVEEVLWELFQQHCRMIQILLLSILP